MNQIPNREKEKRDMELILEVLPHLILGNAEELYNNPDGEMAKNTISEMQRVVRETHHQLLQKAREEVWNKVYECADTEAEKAVWERIKKTAQRDETGMYMFYLADHSELDHLPDRPLNSERD